MQRFISADAPILSKFPEHAKLIGTLITNWNSIENTLVTVLAMTMQQSFELVHPMVYALRNSAARIDVMEPALLELFKKNALDKEAMASTLAEARKVVAMRNKYAHSIYAEDPVTNTLYMLELQDGVPGLRQQANNRPVSISELESAVNRSHALSIKTMSFMSVILAAQPSQFHESDAHKSA